MGRVRLFLLVGLAWCVSGAVALAHDLKVLASHLMVSQPGERTTIYLSWGHTLPVNDLVDAEALERYDLVAPSGSSTPLQKTGLSLQATAVELKEAGVYQAVGSRKPAVFTFVIDKEGNRLLKRGPKSAVTEGKIDYAQRSQQFAKALIVTGPAQAAAVKPLGLPLEIVPLDPPAQWRSGDRRFRVLLHGKPLAHEQLLATYVGFKPDDAWCYATATDGEGIATVRASQAGTWVLRLILRQPTSGDTRGQYDYEAYTATLALEIRP